MTLGSRRCNPGPQQLSSSKQVEPLLGSLERDIAAALELRAWTLSKTCLNYGMICLVVWITAMTFCAQRERFNSVFLCFCSLPLYEYQACSMSWHKPTRTLIADEATTVQKQVAVATGSGKFAFRVYSRLR